MYVQDLEEEVNEFHRDDYLLARVCDLLFDLPYRVWGGQGAGLGPDKWLPKFSFDRPEDPVGKGGATPEDVNNANKTAFAAVAHAFGVLGQGLFPTGPSKPRKKTEERLPVVAPKPQPRPKTPPRRPPPERV